MKNKKTLLLIIMFATSMTLTQFIAPTIASPVLVERGSNYEIWRKNSNTFTWISVSPWIWDGNKYVPYIFEDHYTETGYYLMRNAHITVRLYDNHAEFWDIDNKEVRVQEEKWVVQYFDETWINIDKSNPAFQIITNSSGVFITQSWFLGAPIKSVDTLQVTYALHEARPLKRFVTLTNKGINAYEFRIIQAWDGIVANKVKHTDGDTIVTTSTQINSLWFQFSSEDNDFIILEDLLLSGYFDEDNIYHNDVLQPTSFSLNSEGMSASFTYSNSNTYTLKPGKSLKLDPSTTVNQEYQKTGFIEKVRQFSWPPLTPTAYSGYGIEVGKQVDSPITVYYLQRGYVSFDTSSVDDEWTITDVDLELYLYYLDVDLGADIWVYSGKNEWTTLETNDWDECTHYEDLEFISTSESTGYKTFDIDTDSVATGDGTQRTQFRIRIDDEVTAPTNDWDEFHIAFQNPYSGGNKPKLTITYTE
jgi:hypothetical protein